LVCPIIPRFPPFMSVSQVLQVRLFLGATMPIGFLTVCVALEATQRVGARHSCDALWIRACAHQQESQQSGAAGGNASPSGKRPPPKRATDRWPRDGARSVCGELAAGPGPSGVLEEANALGAAMRYLCAEHAFSPRMPCARMVHYRQIAADRVTIENRRNEMSTFPQDINTAIDRYRGLVRVGEQRALRVAVREPRRAAIAGNLYRGVAHWLSALWANRAGALPHSGAAQGEQVVG